jgi:hypothetical protein
MKKQSHSDAIFGKGFKKGLRHVNCSIGFMLIHDMIDKADGKIQLTKLAGLKKAFLWEYLYYLQHHNRELGAFAVLGKTKNVSYDQLAALIKTNGTVTKAVVANFINQVVQQPSVKIPFLYCAKSQARVIAEYENANAAVVDATDAKLDVALEHASINENTGDLRIRVGVKMEPLFPK